MSSFWPNIRRHARRVRPARDKRNFPTCFLPKTTATISSPRRQVNMSDAAFCPSVSGVFITINRNRVLARSLAKHDDRHARTCPYTRTKRLQTYEIPKIPRVCARVKVDERASAFFSFRHYYYYYYSAATRTSRNFARRSSSLPPRRTCTYTNGYFFPGFLPKSPALKLKGSERLSNDGDTHNAHTRSPDRIRQKTTAGKWRIENAHVRDCTTGKSRPKPIRSLGSRFPASP